MGTANRAELPIWAMYRVIVPVLAGGVMVVSGFLPWLMEPLQEPVSAWQMPLDIGWQFRFGMFNYGLLCLVCALYPFTIAYRAWRAEKHGASLSSPERSCILAACLCCLPGVLWLWQYLFADLGSIAQLTRQETQYLLTSQLFGYNVIAPLVPITNPLKFDPLTLYGRATLLLDQLGIGVFLPLFSALLLMAVRKFFTKIGIPAVALRRWHWVIAFVITPVLLIIFGRAPLAFVYNYQAQHALNSGDYADAYNWFNDASELNPAFDQLPSYHVARGQAWYFLHPDQDTMESRVYLAMAYREQKDYLSAYQELIQVWEDGEHAPWLIDEMSVTLTQLATLPLPLEGSPVQPMLSDGPALPWLNQLLHIDPTNIYGQYMVGRIQYDLHNYAQCEAAMQRVIALSQNANVLSSAYTYLALSSAGQGDYMDARALLLQAVALDPKYRNNTAREELSGLR